MDKHRWQVKSDNQIEYLMANETEFVISLDLHVTNYTYAWVV